MNKEYDINLKLLDIKWTNIQHHEKLRTNLFNIYLIIVGSYFVILQAQKNQFYYAKLGLFAALIILIVGFLFVWSAIHFRSLIARDIKVVRRIYEYFYNHCEEIQGVMKDFEEYYDKANSKRHTALFAMGNALIITTSFISTSVITTAIWIYFKPALFLLISLSIVSILFHILFGWLIGKYAVVN